MTTSLHFLELTELAAHLQRRQLSPVEVARSQLDRLATLDRKLGSYVWVMAEEAMASAANAEREITAGQYRGPLHGVPIAIKDLCWTKDAPATAGMSIHRDFCPADFRPSICCLHRCSRSHL